MQATDIAINFMWLLLTIESVPKMEGGLFHWRIGKLINFEDKNEMLFNLQSIKNNRKPLWPQSRRTIIKILNLLLNLTPST